MWVWFLAIIPLPCKVSKLDSATCLENVVLVFIRGVALLPLHCKVSQLESATYLENVGLVLSHHPSSLQGE
jgi:hypothetical protein